MPVFNAEKYVEQAIESALYQDYSNIELIVVNDGSTDDTQSIIDKFERTNEVIRCIYHPGHLNRGVSFSREIGVRAASGKYVSFLDADDVMSAEKISRQVEFMESNRKVVLVHSDVDYIDDIGAVIQDKKWFDLGEEELTYRYDKNEEFLRVNRVCNSTVLVRTETLLGMQIGFRHFFHFAEDWILWITLSRKGQFAYLPQKLCRYRIHPDSSTTQLENDLRFGLSLVEFYLILVGQDDFFSRQARDELVSALSKVSKLYSAERGMCYLENKELLRSMEKDKLIDELGKLNRQIRSINNSRIWKLRSLFRKLIPN